MHFNTCTWCKILLNKFHKNAYLFSKWICLLKNHNNFKECVPNDVLLINEDVKSMPKISHFSSARLSRNVPNFSTNWDFGFCYKSGFGLYTRSLRCPHKQKSKGFKSGEWRGQTEIKVSIKCVMQPVSNLSDGVLGRATLLKLDFLWINSFPWLNLGYIFPLNFKITGTVICLTFTIFM